MDSKYSSTISWLDSSESERRAVLELVSALNEPGTLDELGIGSIRDTIADFLFPGTSTIQTRARYFLFIPWVLQMVEAQPSTRAEQYTRQLQLQLCDALDRSHGPNQGVIGREARTALQRWPISIYWLGLERWGIRRQVGSLAYYFGSLRRPSSLLQQARTPEDPVEGQRYEAPDAIPGNWAELPAPTPGFPENATFALTAEEGRFLRDCIELKHSHTYLAHILRNGAQDSVSAADFPWDFSSAQQTSASLQAWLNDAQLFSMVHQGASLLYNLMLAEGLGDEERYEDFSSSITDWFDTLQTFQDELNSWDRDAMWRRLWSVNPRLRTRTREFADHWYVLSRKSPLQSLAGGDGPRRLIRERERALKGMRSRLTYAEARDNRRGYPTSARLAFRWTQVKRIVVDILEPLEGPLV